MSILSSRLHHLLPARRPALANLQPSLARLTFPKKSIHEWNHIFLIHFTKDPSPAPLSRKPRVESPLTSEHAAVNNLEITEELIIGNVHTEDPEELARIGEEVVEQLLEERGQSAVDVGTPTVIRYNGDSNKSGFTSYSPGPGWNKGQSREFSTSGVDLASKKAEQLHKMKREFGNTFNERKIATKPLLNALRDMQSHRALTNARQKSNDYRDALRASQLIADWNGTECKPYLTLGELEEVVSPENGVGWRLIYDMVKTGSCPELDQCSEEERAAIKINRMHGFGPKWANAFAAGGARTVEDLQSAEAYIGRVLTKAQKLGIEHAEEMEIMIPRKEAEEFYEIIEGALKKADPELEFDFMGSFRRRESMSSDIDVIVSHPSHKHKTDPTFDLMPKVREALIEAGVLRKDKLFQDGEKKVSGLARLPRSAGDGGVPRLWRQIDIRLCPTQSRYYMLLGNTGDDELMKILRKQANNQGLCLNEYVMGNQPESKVSTEAVPGTEILVNSEEEIFEHLGVPYLEPNERSFRQYSDKLQAFIL